ncbi:hypothetical protein PVT68_15685 [Microbulbifer bruguierae]|uniref:Uncharacterized protein n=1 Tax=Microbulbifer bruguierae TaxID=3029061 RepID=A0ABY8NB98_9GAMM|nr:hypothetical protein [Microbulbifer bruguierae]WGL16201.1 hypothetical protein PVT68_15685 [Microbulbifer bruguierae]
MKPRYKSREWLLLEEAAEYLSKELKEPFGERDMLALLLEGTLPIYWHLHCHHAEEAIPGTCFKDHSNYREGHTPYCAFPAPNGRFEELSGPHEILTGDDPELNRAIITNIHNALFRKATPISEAEVAVTDKEGTWWRLLRFEKGSSATLSGRLNYSTVVTLPQLGEIVVLPSDVESLISSLTPGMATPAIVSEAHQSLTRPHYWGEDLQTLARAADKFWKNADPGDPTTFPKSKDVIAWLEERGISGRAATAGAAMLRPSWAKKK